jgi:hypothetical protein
MKNSRGNATTTYGRMKAREDKKMADWQAKATPGKADPKAKRAYEGYTSAAKKRAQAGAALKASKKK